MQVSARKGNAQSKCEKTGILRPVQFSISKDWVDEEENNLDARMQDNEEKKTV